jgi:hypothetical protein
MTYGTTPSGTTPSGTTPFGTMTYGTTPSGTMTYGTMPSRNLNINKYFITLLIPLIYKFIDIFSKKIINQ